MGPDTMSPESSHKSHAMTWAICVMAMLLFYAATWPIVEIKSCHFIVTAMGGSKSRIDFVQPPWLRVVYWPLHRLSGLNEGQNPVEQYHHWCQRHFKVEIVNL